MTHEVTVFMRAEEAPHIGPRKNAKLVARQKAAAADRVAQLRAEAARDRELERKRRARIEARKGKQAAKVAAREAEAQRLAAVPSLPEVTYTTT